MRKPAGATTYKKVHQKLSEEAIDIHKQELIDTITSMMIGNKDEWENEIEELIREALSTRTTIQLRKWLE